MHYLHVAKPSQPAVNDLTESSGPVHNASRPATPSATQASPQDEPSPPAFSSKGRKESSAQQPTQQLQQQQPGLHDGARTSDASSDSPMLLDSQQSLQNPPPDPYMPLLPSMSLDSFFMAVDDQQCPPLRPLRSNSSLDPFNSIDELSVGAPMDSLTLSGTDWRVRMRLMRLKLVPS